MARFDAPDLLQLAEYVDTGRITLTAAEASLERESDRRELRSLVRALAAVGEHAAATVGSARPSGDRLDVSPTAVRAVPRARPSMRSSFAGAAAALAAVVAVVIVIVIIQPAPPPVGGPTLPPVSAAPTPGLTVAPATPAPTASPAATASAPVAIPTTPPGESPPIATYPPATGVPIYRPVPTAAAGLPELPSQPLTGPNIAFWSLTAPDRLSTWLWDPKVTHFVERAIVDTWPGDTILRTVLFAPNGALFAVHEIDQTTSSPVQRLRVFTYPGDLRWEAPRLTYVTAMAWSPDGTALAIGSLPVPWTVVQFGDTTIGAPPDVSTYELDDQDGYALLGFSEDGKTLLGYGTGGEAEYWEKLVSMNRATGRLVHLDSAPVGETALSHANSTAPVGQFDRGGGILALAGGARGDPHWVIRVGANDVAVPIPASIRLTWGPDRSAIGLGGVGASTGLALDRFDPITGEPAELPRVGIPEGSYTGRLAGVQDGYALVLLSPFPAGDEGVPFGNTEAVLVELGSGHLAVGLAPEGAAEGAFFEFAGWLGQRN